jgi:Fe/S biogenesis protein NfuA
MLQLPSLQMSDTSVLTIGPDALEMICQLRDNEPGEGEFALSIEVTGFRGPQFNYELAFVPLEDKGENWVLERHGELAVIFPKADTGKLDGAALELSEQGLAMNNPNSPAPPEMSAPAGDLSGPLVDRVQQVLSEQVNPAIAAHGGGAELVSVDGTIAYLRLFGGCQGCGLAQVTLKQGIERIILESIPELSQVVDVTDHASGDDPYYQSQKK